VQNQQQQILNPMLKFSQGNHVNQIRNMEKF
jgi:hypothetical protein